MGWWVKIDVVVVVAVGLCSSVEVDVCEIYLISNPQSPGMQECQNSVLVGHPGSAEIPVRAGES